MTDEREDHQPWLLRAAGLALLGAGIGVALDRLLDTGSGGATEDVRRLTLAMFLAVGGIVFAFTVERLRLLWSVAFAIGCGAVAALIFYSNGSPEGWSAGDEWRVFASLLAIAIAAPLFQTARDAGVWRPAPRAVLDHVWTNLVLWSAAWGFVLISYLLAQLLAELFQLIGISLLRDALRESWIVAALIGGAFGAAAGLLRDRDRILMLLQRTAKIVLGVLAPVLAAGLALFVLALPFTGLEPLWDQTRATTPILLTCIFGAVVLANAVIGNAADEEAPARPLRWAAAILVGVLLPLALVAAVSTGKRIDQYGFTPERLWALVIVVIVTVVAIAYLGALARGRAAWPERLRTTNVRLAMGLCAAGLLLATPLIDFGAISTRDQLARLQSGRIAPDAFDWAALRFDFGPSGRAALDRLVRAGPAAWRPRAAAALVATDRWAEREQQQRTRERALAERMRVFPRPVALPASLSAAVAGQRICVSGPCALFWAPGQRNAVAAGFPCEDCEASAVQLTMDPRGGWRTIVVPAPDRADGRPVSIPKQRAAVAAGRVALQPVQRRQVHIDGQPIGPAFE